jgi:predicted ATP-dependent protease
VFLEEFLDARLITGFSGRQGVLIPASNHNHLMLRQGVVAQRTASESS